MKQKGEGSCFEHLVTGELVRSLDKALHFGDGSSLVEWICGILDNNKQKKEKKKKNLSLPSDLSGYLTPG